MATMFTVYRHGFINFVMADIPVYSSHSYVDAMNEAKRLHAIDGRKYWIECEEI